MFFNNKLNLLTGSNFKKMLLTTFIVFLFSNTSGALIVENYDNITDINGNPASYTLLDDYSMTSTFSYYDTDLGRVIESGGLDVNVFFNYSTEIFLYEFSIDPSGTNNISLVSAIVYGDYSDSSSLRAGYSYLDAGSIGFITSYSANPYGSINFNLNSGTWSSGGNTITFYFESLFAPELTELAYSITNSEIKVSSNYSPNPNASLPVPEPSTMMLLFTGFGCLTGVRFRNLFNTKKR